MDYTTLSAQSKEDHEQSAQDQKVNTALAAVGDAHPVYGKHGFP